MQTTAAPSLSPATIPFPSAARATLLRFGLALLVLTSIATPLKTRAQMILMSIEGIKNPDSPQVPEFKLKDFIALQSFSIGVDRPNFDTTKSGTDDITLGAGTLSTVSVTKLLDPTSTLLLRNAFSGIGYSKAVILHIQFVTAGPTAVPVVFLAHRLENIYVKGWSLSASADEIPTEELSLFCTRYGIQYRTPTADTKTAPTGFTGWDLVRSRPWTGVPNLIGDDGKPILP